MRDYIIMTDSCCDLNQQEVDELGLTVLPLSFTIDGKTYLNTPDHAEMSPEEFFAKIAAGENSTTAAANVGQFDEAMRRALDAGKDILCICFSGALSTTYQSACIAAEDLKSEYPDAKISSSTPSPPRADRECCSTARCRSAGGAAPTSRRWRHM